MPAAGTRYGDSGMNRTIAWAVLLAAGGVILSPAALADTKAGVDAWTRGDFATAVREWQDGAARDDADAQFNLGQAYKLGRGVKQDLAQAEDYFSKAAAAGHMQASDNYGLLLFQRGERKQALPFIRAAADRGDPRSQYLLGIAHFNGDIVPKDWIRAYALVSLAQQSGLEQARTALIQMDRHVPLEQRQQATILSAELQSQADATRARQLAAADLGNTLPAAADAPSPVPGRAAATNAVTDAASVAGADSPATAGVDYARPAAAPAVATVRPVAAKPTAPRPAPARPAATATTGGPWRVQLGAFGVAANADALWARLRQRPELAGHPRINVTAGAVTKLQAGGFASEADARAACVKLVAGGFTCIPARN